MTAGSASDLQRELSVALVEDQLVVHYQPIVDLADSRVVGYEALVRWEHPHRGLLLPGAFLPHIQEAGMAVALGQFVATRVVEFVASTVDTTRWVSVNVSADQLGDGEFATTLLGEISRHRLTAGRIVVELTESSLVASGTRIRHDLIQLSAAGVPVLLDDFGTGVPPLSYLRDLPRGGHEARHVVHLRHPGGPDRRQGRPRPGRPGARAGHGDVAEGIEHEEQAEFLHRNGWRYGQGWLYGPAQPGDVSS